MGVITLYCQPGARQTRLAGIHDGKPKIQLQAQPVEGAANKALLRLVADLCEVPLAAVTLLSGAASRVKRIEVAALSHEALAARLLPPARGA